MIESMQAPPRRAPGANEPPPGLYIHIPFCLTKCPYCSFSSLPGTTPPPTEYLTAVLEHAAMTKENPWVAQQTFHTLYIGGGTPTIYDGQTLAGLIANCLALFPFTHAPEISVECNPNTVDETTFFYLRKAGVNRISIGVQSFENDQLQRIGRSHTAEQAKAAFQLARAAGLDNISIDLIYGLPGQTTVAFRETLETAVSLRPEHMSVYELMVEEGTPFAALAEQGALELPEEDTVESMYHTTQEILTSAGYDRYEISNYSLPGYQCRHNSNYWLNASYLGLGASAVSCVSGLRIKNVADPYQYTNLVQSRSLPFQEAECLPLEARFRETVVMGMRMQKGIPIAFLQARFDLSPIDYYGTSLQILIDQNFVAVDKDTIRLTEKGFPIANQILSRLV